VECNRNFTMTDLKKYDFVIVIDRSGSMGTPMPNGKTRWQNAQEATEQWAREAEAYDSDGLTVLTFNETFVEYKNVKASEVSRIFTEYKPGGSTGLHTVLEHVLNQYAGVKNAKPVLVFVITDGAPDDKDKAAKVIAAATHKMTADEEIGIQFIQIGDDSGARTFLESLDDDLQKTHKAKYDIVDTNTFSEAGKLSFEALCEKTLND
jgi:Mg-chelatase subunit ChlD